MTIHDLTPRQQDLAIRAAQSFLRTQGHDLGKTGLHHDGVDGALGPLSIAALQAWGDKVFPVTSQKPAVISLEAMREWYRNLYATMRVTEGSAVVAAVARILRGRATYTSVEARTRVPWRIVGILHYMESGCNFTRHLHNGDPLTDRTTQVPRGRPVAGTPPFTFEQSALDALEYDGFTGQTDWSVEASLYRLEAYNGWGYFKRTAILSPYLWSYSSHYTKGKYVADGKYDPDAVSAQVGAAVLLSMLMQKV